MPPLDIHTLQRLRRILNLSALAEEAGVNKHTLLAKVAKGRALTTDESERIGNILADSGIVIEPRSYFLPDGSVDHIALSKLPREQRSAMMRELMKGAAEGYGPDDIIQVSVSLLDEY